MIDTLLSIVKPIDALGSIPFLIVCLIPGIALVIGGRRTRVIGRNWILSVIAVYVILALPMVANAIANGLPGAGPRPMPDLGPLDALVVFDGDNRRGRVQAASTLFARSNPAVVWVLGGEPEWLRDELPKAGVPARLIRVESRTGNTRDQMAWVSNYRVREPRARAAVIVSRLQMPRVAGLAQRAQVPFPLVSGPIDDEPPTSGGALLVPTYIALRVSRDAIYEHAALVYYRQQGWIGR